MCLTEPDESLLNEYGITHILRVMSKDHYKEYADRLYHVAKATDHPSQDILALLPLALQFIQQALSQENSRVLVHW